MTNKSNQPKRVDLLNKEWRKNSAAGMTISRSIVEQLIDDNGKIEEVIMDFNIRVMGATDDNTMKDMVLEKDDEGNFIDMGDGSLKAKDDPDGKIGSTAIVAVSLGISLQEATDLRRDLSHRAWNTLLLECNKFNGISLTEVESEKKADEPAH